MSCELRNATTLDDQILVSLVVVARSRQGILDGKDRLVGGRNDERGNKNPHDIKGLVSICRLDISGNGQG